MRRVIVGVALLLSLAMAVPGLGAEPTSQSLGELARKERERKKKPPPAAGLCAELVTFHPGGRSKRTPTSPSPGARRGGLWR